MFPYHPFLPPRCNFPANAIDKILKYVYLNPRSKRPSFKLQSPVQFSKIHIIANPISGGRKNKAEIIALLQQRLETASSEVEIRFTEYRNHGTELAQDAVRQKADLVVALGGDGTLNEVASGLVGSAVAMAIIPLGSGNGLARSLGIPTAIPGAVDLVFHGKVTAIDVGKVNARYFFLLTGLGFDAVVGKRFDDHPTRGPVPYFYLSTREFFSYQPPKLKIRFDDKSFEVQPFLITIANGRQYGNNAYIAPAAKLNDGMLNLCIIHRLRLYQLPVLLPKVFQGKIDTFSEVESYTTRNVLIEREQPGLINVDGEPVEEGKTLEISVLPRKLRLVTPLESPGLC